MLHHKGNSNWSLLTIIADFRMILKKTQLLCANDLQPFAVIQHGGDFSSNTSKVTTAFIMKMELIFWKEAITFHYGKWNT